MFGRDGRPAYRIRPPADDKIIAIERVELALPCVPLLVLSFAPVPVWSLPSGRFPTRNVLLALTKHGRLLVRIRHHAPTAHTLTTRNHTLQVLTFLSRGVSAATCIQASDWRKCGLLLRSSKPCRGRRSSGPYWPPPSVPSIAICLSLSLSLFSMLLCNYLITPMHVSRNLLPSLCLCVCAPRRLCASGPTLPAAQKGAHTRFSKWSRSRSSANFMRHQKCSEVI